MLAIKNSQRGATLVTALIMLVVLTLLVVSGIRSSSSNLRIAGNMQMQAEARAAAQQAIEQIISSRVIDTSPQTIGNYTVIIETSSCLSATKIEKSDHNRPEECKGVAGCYWGTWDVVAIATDPNTGASAEIHQGVRRPMGTTEAYAANCGL